MLKKTFNAQFFGIRKQKIYSSTQRKTKSFFSSAFKI